MDEKIIDFLWWAAALAVVCGFGWCISARVLSVRKEHFRQYRTRKAREYGGQYALAVWRERNVGAVDEMPGETLQESVDRRGFAHSWEESAYIEEFVETLRPRVVAMAKEDAKADCTAAAYGSHETRAGRRTFTNTELSRVYSEEYSTECRRRSGGFTGRVDDPRLYLALRNFESGGFVHRSTPGFGETEVGIPVQLSRPEVVQVSAVSSFAALEAMQGSGLREAVRTAVGECVERIDSEVELTVCFRVLEDQSPTTCVAVEALVCPAHLTSQDNVPWVSCGHHVLPDGQASPQKLEELYRIYWQNVAGEQKPAEPQPPNIPQRRLRRRPGDV